ncbi:hypothetical protein D3C80_1329830 [compost metagenome]
MTARKANCGSIPVLVLPATVASAASTITIDSDRVIFSGGRFSSEAQPVPVAATYCWSGQRKIVPAIITSMASVGGIGSKPVPIAA